MVYLPTSVKYMRADASHTDTHTHTHTQTDILGQLFHKI